MLAVRRRKGFGHAILRHVLVNVTRDGDGRHDAVVSPYEVAMANRLLHRHESVREISGLGTCGHVKVVHLANRRRADYGYAFVNALKPSFLCRYQTVHCTLLIQCPRHLSEDWWSGLKDTMANPAHLNRRLLVAVLRAPSLSPLSTKSYLHQNAVSWVRTITSTSIRRQEAPFISFGAENDAVIAQYMQSGKKLGSNKADKQGKTKNAKGAASRATEMPVSAAADDYEISGIIDRSNPVRHKSLKPIRKDQAPGTPSKILEPRQLKASRGTGEKDARKGQGLTKDYNPVKLEKWGEQKNALKEKFTEGWNPRKKLSPDAMEGIRGLHEQDPVNYSTPVLAEHFKVSPEAIRRILKSKWLNKADPSKMEERRERWAKRHDRIWDTQAELGLRPYRKKEREIEDPEKFEKDMVRKEVLGEM